jgi:MFS family permease
MTSPLAFPGVRPLLLARVASASAMQIIAVAVGWQVYALTGSALDLGFIGLAQFLPAAALALVSGQVVDLFPRRNVVIAAQSCQAACAAVLLVLALFGATSLVAIFCAVGVYGAARSFEQPATSALLPALVPPAILPRAIAFNSSTFQGAVILGPSIGGVLLSLGFETAIGCVALLLLLAAAAVAATPRVPAPPREALSWRRLFDGIAFIRSRPAVFGAISLDMFGVLFGGATALLPIFARDILGVGSTGFGLLRSAPAVGALAAAAYFTWAPLRRRPGAMMLGAVAVFGAATILFGISRDPVLSLIALAATGASDMVSVVVRSTLIQTQTPDALRGRVGAINSLFIGTSNQLGEFESGVVAAWLGPEGSVVLGGAVSIVLAGLWAARFPSLRRLAWAT